MITAQFTLASFQGYADDAVTASATTKAAINTDWTQDVDENFRVRIEANESAGGGANNVGFQWQYRKNGGTWTNITTTSSNVKAVASPYFAQDDDTSQFIGSGGTYVTDNDAFSESGATTSATADYTANAKCEAEVCLQIVGADVADSDTIEIRVEAGSGYTHTDTNIPSITVNESTPDALTATDITTGTPVLGTPTIGQTHALTSVDIATSNPTLGNPAIGQTHALTSVDITAGTPVLGTPTIQVVTPLTATDIATGGPVLGTPDIGQEHALDAVDIATAAPDTGTPDIGQVHALTAVDIATGAPTLGTSTAGVAGGTDALTAEDIATGTPTLGAPTLGIVGQCSWTADTTEITADDTTATADGSCVTAEAECVWTTDSTSVTADSTQHTADGYDPSCDCGWSADSTLITADSTGATADGYDPSCWQDADDRDRDGAPKWASEHTRKHWERLYAEDRLILGVIEQFLQKAA